MGVVHRGARSASLSTSIAVRPEVSDGHDAGGHDAGGHDAGGHDAGGHDAGVARR